LGTLNPFFLPQVPPTTGATAGGQLLLHCRLADNANDAHVLYRAAATLALDDAGNTAGKGDDTAGEGGDTAGDPRRDGGGDTAGEGRRDAGGDTAGERSLVHVASDAEASGTFAESKLVAADATTRETSVRLGGLAYGEYV